MGLTISETQKEVHKNAVSKGFWDEPLNVGEKLMLIVSELSEALEADRKGKHYMAETELLHTLGGYKKDQDGDFTYYFEKAIKDTFEDELADAVIRIMDLSEKIGINLEEHIKAKMRFNESRPYKHGKKY